MTASYHPPTTHLSKVLFHLLCIFHLPVFFFISFFYVCCGCRVTLTLPFLVCGGDAFLFCLVLCVVFCVVLCVTSFYGLKYLKWHLCRVALVWVSNFRKCYHHLSSLFSEVFFSVSHIFHFFLFVKVTGAAASYSLHHIHDGLILYARHVRGKGFPPTAKSWLSDFVYVCVGFEREANCSLNYVLARGCNVYFSATS